MSIDSLKRDIAASMRRLSKTDLLDAREELLQNTYPLLASIVEEMDELAGAVDDVAEAVDFEGSVIERDLGLAIITTFGVAQAVVELAEKALGDGALNDIEKASLKAAIDEWKRIHEPVAHDVADAMVEEEADDDDAEDDEDDDGESDEEEGVE